LTDHVSKCDIHHKIALAPGLFHGPEVGVPPLPRDPAHQIGTLFGGMCKSVTETTCSKFLILLAWGLPTRSVDNFVGNLCTGALTPCQGIKNPPMHQVQAKPDLPCESNT